MRNKQDYKDEFLFMLGLKAARQMEELVQEAHGVVDELRALKGLPLLDWEEVRKRSAMTKGQGRYQRGTLQGDLKQQNLLGTGKVSSVRALSAGRRASAGG